MLDLKEDAEPLRMIRCRLTDGLFTGIDGQLLCSFTFWMLGQIFEPGLGPILRPGVCLEFLRTLMGNLCHWYQKMYTSHPFLWHPVLTHEHPHMFDDDFDPPHGRWGEFASECKERLCGAKSSSTDDVGSLCDWSCWCSSFQLAVDVVAGRRLDGVWFMKMNCFDALCVVDSSVDCAGFSQSFSYMLLE